MFSPGTVVACIDGRFSKQELITTSEAYKVAGGWLQPVAYTHGKIKVEMNIPDSNLYEVK
jgi:hypothetical protein